MRVVLCGWMASAGLAAAGALEDFARGVLEEARGGDGLEHFAAARAADPGAWPLASRVAAGHAAAGEIEAASTIYREYVAAHPERLEARLAYADFLRESSPQDDFAARLAGEALEAGLVRHPGHPELVRRLFRTYEQRGMREKSMELYEAVAESGPALVAAEMARTLFPADDEEARARVDALYVAGMERTPADPVLARAASEHFRTSGRLMGAVEMLEKHVAAAPSSLELRTRLGVLLFAAERHVQGRAVLEEVLAIDPRQALAHQALAKHFRREELAEKALPHAAEVLKLRGGDAGEFAELAEEFMAAERPREARLLLEKGVFDHPDDPELAVALAVATRRDPETAARAGRLFREAEAVADEAAARPVFQMEFAEVLLEAGETAAAEDRLRAAIKGYGAEDGPDTARALRRLAGIWEAEGRNSAAARALLDRAAALER